MKYLIILVLNYIYLQKKVFSFEHFEILTVSTMMTVMASAISGLNGNKAFISLVITSFLSFFIDLSGLMLVKVICNTCNKSVSCRNLIECSLCLTMVHLKCNNLNVVDAEIIKNTGSDRFWICMFCSNNLFPFATLNDHKLYQTLSQSNNHYSGSSNSYSTNTCSTLKPPKNLSNLFNEFNNFSSQQNKNTENIMNCKYYDIEEIQSRNNLNHKNALSHNNTCSLSKNIEELEYLLDKTKIDFDVIGISESRIKKDKSSINSINLKGYSVALCSALVIIFPTSLEMIYVFTNLLS